MGIVSGINAADATIGNLSIGIDIQGMQAYRESLKTQLITECKTKLEQTDGISNAITAGWQGVSRDRFLKDLEETIIKIEEDLEAEYADLESRLLELESNYFEQDSNMINE